MRGARVQAIGALGLWAAAAPAVGEPLDRSVYAMGTTLAVHLDSARDRTSEASERAIREVERIEAACSTWRADSAWSGLNRAGGQPFALAPEWIDLLAAGLDFGNKTQGAFDPVLGALIEVWGIRQGGRTPTVRELDAARAASGASLLTLSRTEGTARLSHGARVEEGGFVKGYALDRALREIRASGVTSGWLDFGGQVLAFGSPAPVAIADPVDRAKGRFKVLLANASVSTSGTSEHGRHILDPHTGQRCPAWGSTSVVSPDAFSADVLSTALYVMGPERGLVWADANGVAALFQINGAAPRMSRAFLKLRPEAMEARPH